MENTTTTTKITGGLVAGATLAILGAVAIPDSPKIEAYEQTKVQLIEELEEGKLAPSTSILFGEILVIAEDEEELKISLDEKYSKNETNNSEAYVLSSIINKKDGDEFNVRLREEGMKFKNGEIKTNQGYIMAIQLINQKIRNLPNSKLVANNWNGNMKEEDWKTLGLGAPEDNIDPVIAPQIQQEDLTPEVQPIVEVEEAEIEEEQTREPVSRTRSR